jgi:NAD-dependent dihydropyrimidine dehydrogenase PreA subunit
MPYVIGEACLGTMDQSCIEVCPVDCIHETARMLVVDPELCIDCGACEPECPVSAILPIEDLPPEWEPFVSINAAWRDGGQDAVEAALDAHLGVPK